MQMPVELSLHVQRFVRTMISGLMLVQCFTVYVYLAAYIVLLYPVFFVSIRSLSHILFENGKNKSASRCNPHTQGRQREPSIKTLRSLISAKFWRYCMLSGGTQRRVLPRYQCKEREI